LVYDASWDATDKHSALLTGLSTELKQLHVARDLPYDYDALVDVLKSTDNKILAMASQLRSSYTPPWCSNPITDLAPIPNTNQCTSKPAYLGLAPKNFVHVVLVSERQLNMTAVAHMDCRYTIARQAIFELIVGTVIEVLCSIS
jgi:hypothetical protein